MPRCPTVVVQAERRTLLAPTRVRPESGAAAAAPGASAADGGRRPPPRLDAQILGDGAGRVVTAGAADRTSGVGGGAAQVDVFEGRVVGRVLVEGSEDPEL